MPTKCRHKYPWGRDQTTELMSTKFPLEQASEVETRTTVDCFDGFCIVGKGCAMIVEHPSGRSLRVGHYSKSNRFRSNFGRFRSVLAGFGRILRMCPALYGRSCASSSPVRTGGTRSALGGPWPSLVGCGRRPPAEMTRSPTSSHNQLRAFPLSRWYSGCEVVGFRMEQHGLQQGVAARRTGVLHLSSSPPCARSGGHHARRVRRTNDQVLARPKGVLLEGRRGDPTRRCRGGPLSIDFGPLV